MRTFISSLIYFSFIFLMIPTSSNAFNDGARIDLVVAYFEADDECAVETEFTSFQGGGFITGFEGLYVDGAEWANLGGLPTSGYQVGDRISWGTESLELKLNYTFDVRLSADFCQNLQLGSQLSYRGSGGTDLSTFNFDAAPMLHMAYSFNQGTGLYDPWSLDTNSVTITSLDGSTVTFGGGTVPSTGNGGGCSLALIPASSHSVFWISGLGFGFLLWLRKRV